MNIEYKRRSKESMVGRFIDGKTYKLRQYFTIDCKDNILKDLVIVGSILGDSDYILDEEMNVLTEMISEIKEWTKVFKMLKNLYGIVFESKVSGVEFYESSNGTSMVIARKSNLKWLYK